MDFDIGDFNKKFEVVEWLSKYDVIAWWTTDSVLAADVNERKRAGGKDWFCYQAPHDTWHAIYGKFANDTFDLVFHYVVDSTRTVRRTYDLVDTLLLNSYSRALQTANKQLTALRDTVKLHFNQFIKQNDDRTFSVWIFPAFQSDGTAVYGGEFIYTIDQSGTNILKDDSYFVGDFYGAKTNKRQEIWLNYPRVDKPTLGGIFFTWYYRDYFKQVTINCSKSNSFLLKDEKENKWSWVHIEK